MNMEKAGKYIKELRTNKGLSQNELGDMVHVTRQAVSSWENGKTLPDSDVLMSLSKLFDVSINDILTGGDKTDLEDITLKLVDENNKNISKLKKTFLVSSLTILFLLLFFLGYYFINNYNSIKVYRAAGVSDHFKIEDGVIISTSKNTYFKLGKIEVKKNDEEIKVEKVRAYYKKDNKEIGIFESDIPDTLFVTNSGYNGFRKNELMKYKKDIYLEITYNDSSKEFIKLKLYEVFKNDFSLAIENSRIINKNLSSQVDNQLQIVLAKEQENFERNFQVRQEETEDKIPVIEYKEPVVIQPVIQPTVPVQEPVKVEENITLEKEPEPSPEPEVKEEPVAATTEEPINYDEIISIIETYGVNEFRTYRLEYELEDGTQISISVFRKTITVETLLGNTKKEFILKNNSIGYKKEVDYSIEENKVIELENEVSEDGYIIDEMNSYLKLVYQEIQ